MRGRLSQVAAVPRHADFFIKCASEVRKLKFREKKKCISDKNNLLIQNKVVVPQAVRHT